MNKIVQELRLSRGMLPCLSSVFQKGVRVEIETGCTIESLLYDQWALSPEYVTERISTLFLNGKPVDDLSTARVATGAVLALSSAMPGLVGAVMRRDGFFSSLREGITYREKTSGNRIHRGLITVKLFNLLIEELGPRFLKKGFFVNRDDLLDNLADDLAEHLAGESGKQHAGGGDIFIIHEII
jgi:hypothetical protein